jgi:hypothetical protein
LERARGEGKIMIEKGEEMDEKKAESGERWIEVSQEAMTDFIGRM